MTAFLLLDTILGIAREILGHPGPQRHTSATHPALAGRGHTHTRSLGAGLRWAHLRFSSGGASDASSLAWMPPIFPDLDFELTNRVAPGKPRILTPE